MDPTIRLRIATRIHFALLRHYGEDVAVSTLLRDEAQAHEALWVCEASGVDELVTLAKQLVTANRQEAGAARMRAQQAARIEASAPQDMAWSRDTSGFGLTRPLETLDAPATGRGSWLRPSNWLRTTG
ncbi:MAG: hypothetical protein ABI702_23410 [Burkholderiales bacterium]